MSIPYIMDVTLSIPPRIEPTRVEGTLSDYLVNSVFQQGRKLRNEDQGV